MIKAFYSFIAEPFDKRLLKGVIYDITDNKNGSVDISLDGEYITWCSNAYFENRFTTLAEWRDKRIDEILED